MTLILAAGGRRRGAPSPPSYPTTAPFNVTSWAFTPTYEGSNSPVHPDVLDFQQITGSPWRGWRYWMAMTPFPLSQSKFENPSVIVSQDGLNWSVPPGLTNPIYPWPVTGWLSDTDLSYDPDVDQLVLVYRDENFLPRVARSSDGVTWPATSTIMDWPPLVVGSTPTEAVSPALVRDSGSQWSMWMIAARSGRLTYRWTAPAPEGPWSPQQQCSGFATFTHWHLDVVKHAGVYRAVVHDRELNRIIPASSTDGLAWSRGEAVIEGGAGGWDTDLYRTTLTPHENGTHMRVWYGGRPAGGTGELWRVALTEVPLTAWPAPPT